MVREAIVIGVRLPVGKPELSGVIFAALVSEAAPMCLCPLIPARVKTPVLVVTQMGRVPSPGVAVAVSAIRFVLNETAAQTEGQEMPIQTSKKRPTMIIVIALPAKDVPFLVRAHAQFPILSLPVDGMSPFTQTHVPIYRCLLIGPPTRL